MLTRGQACGSSTLSTSLKGTILKLALILYPSGVFESATTTCAVVLSTRKQILACCLGCGSDGEGFCRRTGGSSHSSSASAVCHQQHSQPENRFDHQPTGNSIPNFRLCENFRWCEKNRQFFDWRLRSWLRRCLQFSSLQHGRSNVLLKR